MSEDIPDIEQPASDAKDTTSEPVWHKPAWITAIVGVISAFLTIPDVVGNYLSKQQEVAAAALANEQANQSKEFEVVQNTLSRQGTERVFMLRYFAATLDDDEARNWAKAEVARLDRLVELQAALDTKEAEIARLRDAGELAAAQQERLAALEAELETSRLELTKSRESAGIERAARRATVLHWRLTMDWPEAADPGGEVVVSDRRKQWSVRCTPETGRLCQGFARAGVGTIVIEGLGRPAELSGTLIAVAPDPLEPIAISPSFDFDCAEITDRGGGLLFWQCRIPRDVVAPYAADPARQMQIQFPLSRR